MLAPLGWAAEDDVALLAMELVRAGRCATCSPRTGRSPTGCVAPLLGQLLDALAAVHARGSCTVT